MRRLVLFLIPAVILGALIVWRVENKKAAQAQLMHARVAHMKAPPKVSLAKATIRDLRDIYTVTGTLDSPLTVKISSKVTGRVTYLQVQEGDRISKGEVLVRIDDSQVLAEVRQAQAALAEAQFKLAQAQYTQTPADVQVKTNIQTARAGVASAQADYEQAKQNYASQVAAAEASVTDAQGRIDNAAGTMRVARASINSAQANLNDAKIKYNRTYSLYKQGFVAAQDVDDAKAALLVQQAAVTQAQSQLQAATATHDSAAAQKKAAQNQLSITKTTGQATIEASHQKLLQAQAALQYAESNKPQIPAYKESLKALRATVAVNEASVSAAKAQLSDTVLRSPLDGYVTARLMDPGAMATPGQEILEVRYFGNVWVDASVPDSVASKVQTGQQEDVRFDAIPNQVFKATVIQLNPSADPQAHQFTIRASMPNPTGQFKPGMIAKVAITTAQAPQAVAVPKEALQTGPSGQYVVVVGADEVAHFAPVVTGMSDANFVAITKGLAAGESVVVLTSVPLKDGEKVNTGAGGGAQGSAARGAGGSQAPGAKGPQQGSPGSGPQRPSSAGTPAPSSGPAPAGQKGH